VAVQQPEFVWLHAPVYQPGSLFERPCAPCANPRIDIPHLIEYPAIEIDFHKDFQPSHGA
jgi:hypothetical protein